MIRKGGPKRPANGVPGGRAGRADHFRTARTRPHVILKP